MHAPRAPAGTEEGTFCAKPEEALVQIPRVSPHAARLVASDQRQSGSVPPLRVAAASQVAPWSAQRRCPSAEHSGIALSASGQNDTAVQFLMHF